MSTEPLDRPIWHTLTTRLSRFAEGGPRALRFVRDVNLFAATRDDTPESLHELAKLIPADGPVVLIQVGDIPVPSGAAPQMTALGVQMVAENIAPLEPNGRIEALTEADASAILELATLTKPGPFLARTHELGQFWGVKENGKLVAMAGERMRLPGFTEVSGVCTHPDVRGRGYARLLSRVVATRIMKRGETPFLHAYASNTPAVSLYETLGFRLRCHVNVMVLARA